MGKVTHVSRMIGVTEDNKGSQKRRIKERRIKKEQKFENHKIKTSNRTMKYCITINTWGTRRIVAQIGFSLQVAGEVEVMHVVESK